MSTPSQRQRALPRATGVSRGLETAARSLSRRLSQLEFGRPVSAIYDPLRYAARPHRAYLTRYGRRQVSVLFLGMNPGPFGMVQTGVPFGDVRCVRDWLGIEAPVGRPDCEHPRRPVQGFDCARSEVSGTRLWGAIAEHWGRPEAFFADHFIANYCPLAFLEDSGRNRTPDKLPAAERTPLYAACDSHLRRVVELLRPSWLIGIGRFAARRAEEALPAGPRRPRIAPILHPSPANPRANRDWSGEVRRQLCALGVYADRAR